MPTIAPLVALSALAILGTTVTPAAAATTDKPITCRGKGVAPDALIGARTETVIHAPLSTIWKLQTDVERRPSWQPPVSTIERLDHGPFRQGRHSTGQPRSRPTPKPRPPAWTSARRSSS
jgi:hypothetical protein